MWKTSPFLILCMKYMYAHSKGLYLIFNKISNSPFGKPLPELLLSHSELDAWQQASGFNSVFENQNIFENVYNMNHFVRAWICLS